MLRMEKAALTDSNQNKDEIILNLTNENKKNDKSRLLRQHVGVMLRRVTHWNQKTNELCDN